GLSSSPPDERHDRSDEATPAGGQGEDRDANGKEAPSPVQITQRSSHENERGEKERIGFHNPLHISGRGAQVLLDHWQGDIDDGAINKSHARSKDGSNEYPDPNLWGTGLSLSPRANHALITGRFHEGGHVGAL